VAEGCRLVSSDDPGLIHHRADTPMLALSRTIEINLRQQLGETDLPDKVQPKDGVLM